jgi:MoxR-like ATPase
MEGRDYVIPDDIKKVAFPVLTHRLIIKPSARTHNLVSEDIIKEILESVEIPARGE